MIEVRYAGVVVGRSAVIRELDTRGLFLGVTEPLPVGTPVVLRIGEGPDAPEAQGKVEVVSESPELAHAGMRVRFADPGAAALFGEPTGSPSDSRPHAISGPRSGPVADGTVVASGTRPESTAPVRIEPPRTLSREDPAPVPAPASAPLTPAAPPRTIEVQPSPQRATADSSPVPQPSGDEDGDESLGVSTAGATDPEAAGRIPAPDPSAFGGHGGGKKNRKNRRR